ncbi:glycosyltransferase family 2 protein [Pantoea sp. NPDC088449]|uniref:glycosyltransferase family 2 protein n=1 Tax=Pantoea sp. NPDC088449 TaxID=3364392 RepID=UPI00382DE117
MLNQLKFLWYYHQKHYAHAAAAIINPKSRQEKKNKLLAMYRLSMYNSVAQLPIIPSCWQSHLAKAVSFAACGEYEAAQQLITSFQYKYVSMHQKMALTIGLMPFMPQVALKIIEELPNSPPALHIALLMRNGRFEQVRSMIERLPESIIVTDPELLLLQTNAYKGTPEIQLQRLNMFLAAYNLSPLRLNDPMLAPSPINLSTNESPDMQSGPLISILMTTFNTGYRAEHAVFSLLAQNYKSIEIIIVDDASTDDTPVRLEKLVRMDKRIKLIRLPRNVGTYAAKRLGLTKAQGQFVTCHDSDDWSHPEKLTQQLAPMLVDPTIVCTVSNWVRMQDDGVFYARPVYPLKRLNPSSPLFRREMVLCKAGVWDCVKTGADSEFLARLKLVFGAKAIKKVNQPLTFGSHRADSLMTSADTGYLQNGISSERQKYWEAWSLWHISHLATGEKPFIDPFISVTESRPFEVPVNLQVNLEALAECKNSAIKSTVQ